MLMLKLSLAAVALLLLTTTSPAFAGNYEGDNYGGMGGYGARSNDPPGTFSMPNWTPGRVPCQTCGMPSSSGLNSLLSAIRGWFSLQPASKTATQFDYMRRGIVSSGGFGIGIGSFRAEPGPTGY